MFCKSCGCELKPGVNFCTNCGRRIEDPQDESKTRPKNKFRISMLVATLFLLTITMVLIVVIYFFKDNKNSFEKINHDIAATVVNIYCEGADGWDGKSVSGGSGTIITEKGLVLTNAHIIPQGKEESLNEKSCLVILPDPTTGSSKEIYYAKPLVVPEISKKYDIAFIQIDDVYYDKEEGKAYGEYPKEFPAYDSSRYCKNENVKLGEPVRIYGYPAISGGYALTITDGIISSLLPNENLIITSAKISSGNSGGLAVDGNGCMIGIPSMVSSDENESLGVIISNDLILEFMDKVSQTFN